ncbi:MAG TPA: nitronate monooxygenase [Ktedonobacterales bacterium]|nr:nitronate monooxygenase [Ktedonobacterales bacterium]
METIRAEMLPETLPTRVTALLGIRYPIVQGGLAHLSYGDLAAAVSEAGGLGQVGVACFETAEELRAEIAKVRALTSRPFGVNFPIGHSPVDHFLEVALEEGVPVLTITGGNPEALLRRIQAHSPTPRTMVLVAGTRAARKAEDLGADAVIAVGFEGGGHLGRDDIGTMVLVPRVVEAVTIPVLASGGIADGRGLAAALALGAEGVELGTRFIAVQENVAHQHYKEALVRAQETDTVVIERTLGRPARVLKGPLPDKILEIERDLEQRGASREEALPALLPYILGTVNKRAAREGVLEEGFVWAGQVAGLIKDIPAAGDLVRRMVFEAAIITQRVAQLFAPAPLPVNTSGDE